VMIPKMGRDSQGSTLFIFFKFIYCFIYILLVHLLFYLCSSSSFIALFVCFELFIALICRSEYIYRFVYIYYVLANIIL
jgi:hypothetical protein